MGDSLSYLDNLLSVVTQRFGKDLGLFAVFERNFPSYSPYSRLRLRNARFMSNDRAVHLRAPKKGKVVGCSWRSF